MEEVRFDKAEHKYFNVETGEEYVSVTTFIDRECPFDRGAAVERAIESKSSAYYGWKEEDVLSKWEEIQVAGTKLHDSISKYMGGCRLESVDIEDRQAVYWFSRGKWSGKLESEVLLFSHSLKIAGTCDVIQREIRNGIDTRVIFDIKTSATINEYKLVKFSKQLWLYKELLNEMLCELAIEDMTFFGGLFENEVPHVVKVGGIVHYKDYLHNRKSRPEFVKCLDMSNWIAELREGAMV